ncbi:MAG: putative lipoprotein YiaD [Candidatus Erwinia impunctatus]|nr:putative lipoprotein YiaD [Culicoides impunctatus]
MSAVRQALLALWAAALSAFLCLSFLPVTLWISLLITGAIWTGIALYWYLIRRDRELTPSFCSDSLPPSGYRQPVVLVCGDNPDSWPETSRTRVVSQGCFIKVDDPQTLMPLVSQLFEQRPDWGKQLAVMITVCPQLHTDSTALSGYLLAWRWQLSLLRRKSRLVIPLVLNIRIGCAMTPQPLWQVIRQNEISTVWQETGSPRLTGRAESGDHSQNLAQQMVTNSLMSWSREYCYARFTEANPEIPVIVPEMSVLGSEPAFNGALPVSAWTTWLSQHTGIPQAEGWQPVTERQHAKAVLPEIILPLLPAGLGVTPRQRLCRRAITLLLLAYAVALVCSGWNNTLLLRRVNADLTRYAEISMDDTAKVTAVELLRQDLAQLNRWARHGVPLRFSLGLYHGEHLRMPLLNAIRTYTPPAISSQSVVHDKAAEIIRLDSMSLFDSGKAELKPDSTRLLVNSLVGIKGKPGWLIVVAGHTDSTGNHNANQILSLKRAESVRNWMRDTGDLPESCFAVQGYGADRPLVSNDTAEGRARNRRVEISLVPQADACRIPGEQGMSSQDDDVLHNERE